MVCSCGLAWGVIACERGVCAQAHERERDRSRQKSERDCSGDALAALQDM
jgi:hypothetical protein